MISIRKRAYPVLVRSHVRGSTLPPEVLTELRRFLNANPDLRAGEAAEHGFDPLQDPARYLAAERAEGDHESLRSGQPIDLQTVKRWEQEETSEYASGVRKDAPAASDVHVDSTDTGDQPAAPRKRKRKPPTDEADVEVVKADAARRLVYGVVLEPDVEDTQGDIVSPDDVEKAAHGYVYDHIRPDIIGDQHRQAAPPTVRPVESFVAPCDFTMGDQTIRKGSWVLVGKIDDDELWQQVLAGQKTGWSVGGVGRRVPL